MTVENKGSNTTCTSWDHQTSMCQERCSKQLFLENTDNRNHFLPSTLLIPFSFPELCWYSTSSLFQLARNVLSLWFNFFLLLKELVLFIWKRLLWVFSNLISERSHTVLIISTDYNIVRGDTTLTFSNICVKVFSTSDLARTRWNSASLSISFHPKIFSFPSKYCLTPEIIFPFKNLILFWANICKNLKVVNV